MWVLFRSRPLVKDVKKLLLPFEISPSYRFGKTNKSTGFKQESTADLTPSHFMPFMVKPIFRSPMSHKPSADVML